MELSLLSWLKLELSVSRLQVSQQSTSLMGRRTSRVKGVILPCFNLGHMDKERGNRSSTLLCQSK